MTTDSSRNSPSSGTEGNDDHLFDRREFMKLSAYAVLAAAAAKAGFVSKSAQAQSLSTLLSRTEAELYYRDRLPDYQTPFDNDPGNAVSLFEWNFPDLVESAYNGVFGSKGMPSHFSTFHQIPEAYLGMPVAIVGAGAAGLAAGYELMKIGLKPVFYEMQTQDDPKGGKYARACGRIYSWDYGGNGSLEGAGGGWYPTQALTLSTVKPSEGNTHRWGRRVAELGGMRFPATHLTLRTYTDAVFGNDYFYGDFFDTPWTPFRDPGLYAPKNQPDPSRGGVIKPSDGDTIVYDTVYHTKGIFEDRKNPNPPEPGGYAQTDRVVAGTPLESSNAAVHNLTYRYFDLLFGDVDSADPYQGILTPILELYSEYTANPTADGARAIADEWQALVERFDTMSLREVLVAAGWAQAPAYAGQWGGLNVSLSEMFGEIGTGTGPFAMFYYSTFMELLRIALQAADSNQDYFRGGAGYQLQPFLTGFDLQRGSSEPTCLWNETQGRVITDKVVAIEKVENGISVTTQDAAAKRTSTTYAAVVVTASPSALRAADMFPSPDGFVPSRVMSYIKRVRINNNSKIAINFPNLASEKYSSAFWMRRGSSDPDDPNNDLIVTTLTDKTIRQIYTFDNYHWATIINDTNNFGPLTESGTLMLNYGWDYNAQSWSADDPEVATRTAWRQMTEIYGFGDQYDPYLEWALANNQTAFIVWEKVDGFNAAWRMAQPGRGTDYGDPNSGVARYSEFRTTQTFGMSSFNPETNAYTGLFIAGEASASPGLSGWVEGSIQTALQAVGGIVKFLNVAEPVQQRPTPRSGVSFALHAHPGFRQAGHAGSGSRQAG